MAHCKFVLEDRGDLNIDALRRVLISPLTKSRRSQNDPL